MKYSYVSTLYGDNDYYFGALVLGYSLKKVTQYPLTLLVTDDVPDWKLSNLEKYWTIYRVDYLEPHPNWIKDYQKTRFRGVFTKLNALALTEYSKVLLLDTDMLVQKNMDEIFTLKAPAALLGGRTHLKYGEKIPKGGQINAGIMLLKPDLQEYKSILWEINRRCPHEGYGGPEQQYLSDRWSGRWRHLSYNFNFQYYNYDNDLLPEKVKKDYLREEIYNIHYSFKIKPWHLYLTQKKDAKGVINRYKAHKNYAKYFIKWLDMYRGVNRELGIDLTQEYNTSGTLEKKPQVEIVHLLNGERKQETRKTLQDMSSRSRSRQVRKINTNGRKILGQFTYSDLLNY